MEGKSQNRLATLRDMAPVDEGRALNERVIYLRASHSQMLCVVNEKGGDGAAIIDVVDAVYPSVHVLAVVGGKPKLLREEGMKRGPVANGFSVNCMYCHVSSLTPELSRPAAGRRLSANIAEGAHLGADLMWARLE